MRQFRHCRTYSCRSLVGYLLALMIVLTSCAAPKLTEQPDTNRFDRLSFDIDEIAIVFDIPSGGDIGEHNSFGIETADLEGDFQILFSFGYDHLVTRTKWYNVSNLLFGVEKIPANRVGEFRSISIADELTTFGKCEFEQNGNFSTSEAYTDTDGDFVDRRLLKFNEEYALFFTLRVYSEHVDYPGMLDSRREMLGNIVSSIVCDET